MTFDKDVVKPNFFLIGAPRSGTTALSMYLREHPRVFFSNPKEPQYFATDFRNRFVIRESTYLGLFRDANPEIHLAIGEGSTWYLFSKEAVPNILVFQPDARFIVMLRHPAKLVFSLHRYMVMQGKENVVDFWRAWSLQEKRRQGQKVPLGCGDTKLVIYSEWGKLGSQMQKLLSLVPRERVFVILLDEFVLHPRRIWVSLLNFLGVPDDGRDVFPRVNESIGLSLTSARLRRGLGIARSVFSKVRAHIGSTWGSEFGYSSFLRMFGQRGNEKKIAGNVEEEEKEIITKLTGYYRDEIFLLTKILGRDLNIWLQEPWRAA